MTSTSISLSKFPTFPKVGACKHSYISISSVPMKFLRHSPKLHILCKSSSDSSNSFVQAEQSTEDANPVEDFKFRLLNKVATADRGLAASEAKATEIESEVESLEAFSSQLEFPRDLKKVDGVWQLVYSSGFLSGSLGGRRPGPPAGKVPLRLGEVTQRIDVGAKEFDNIVDLQVYFPWSSSPAIVQATLSHSFECFGKASTRIIFEKTSLKGKEGLSALPEFAFPQLPEFLKPPKELRSGEFETTYVDNDFRITRGDRGELRIFIRKQ